MRHFVYGALAASRQLRASFVALLPLQFSSPDLLLFFSLFPSFLGLALLLSRSVLTLLFLLTLFPVLFELLALPDGP
jgi:hypothetical protein